MNVRQRALYQKTSPTLEKFAENQRTIRLLKIKKTGGLLLSQSQLTEESYVQE